MSISKHEAEAFLKGNVTMDELGTSETSQSQSESDTSSVGNATSTEDNTAKSESETVVAEDSSSMDSNLEKVSQDKVENKKSYKRSPEEKQKYAFMKEKNKRREVQAKLNAKQKEIEELMEKLKKYEGLTKDNFEGNEDAYTDYKIDQRYDREKVSRLQKEYEDEAYQMQMAEAEEIANYRFQTNFPDEAERNAYANLVQNAETNFSSMHPEYGFSRFSDFLKSEKDGTVIQYLQDSDYSPKLIRHFIHKPEAAMKIMNMRNPYNKIVELKQLENRMLQHERMMAAKNKQLSTPKRELPNTGKVVSNSINANQIDYDRPVWTKKETEAWLRNHK